MEKKKPTHLLSPERRNELERRQIDWNKPIQRANDMFEKMKTEDYGFVDRVAERQHRRSTYCASLL